MNERRLPKKESENLYLDRKKEKDIREANLEIRLRQMRFEDMLERHERIIRGKSEPKRINIGKRQLDVFAIMQVLPYINDGQTMFNLMLTTKKFELINKRLPKNHYDLITRRDQLLFEHVDTLVIYTPISLKPIYMKIKESEEIPENHLEKEYTKSEINEMKRRKTEEDKRIIRDIMLNKERTGVEIEKDGRHVEMSIHDIGEVVAPIFKNFTNIEIRLDFDWMINYSELADDLRDYSTLMDLDRFMIEHDERGYEEKIRFVEENKNKDIIIIPNDWKVLPAEIFQDFLFHEIILNSELFLIGKSAISSCMNLKRIFIPSSVQIIRSYVFLGCINLEEVIFENESELKIVERDVFGMTKIKHLIFPDQVEQVGLFCFAKCHELEYVRFPQSIKEIEEPFRENDNLEIIEIPIKMQIKIENDEIKLGKIPEKTQIIYY